MPGMSRLVARTREVLQTEGPMAVVRYAKRYLRRHRMYKVEIDEQELAAQRKASFPQAITISILVPLYNTPEPFLKEMIDSVTAQTYGGWELCLADGSDAQHADVGEYCQARAQQDQRIKYRRLSRNGGISENTNACIDMATGEYIALFDHDDLLVPSALYEVMKAICEQGADYVYTDEATFRSPDRTKIITAHFKPDFAPDNLRTNNYICHLSVFAREVLDAAGPFNKEYDGSQDHEMIMRLTEHAKKIVHVPKVLYLWRSHPNSTAADIGAKTYAIDAGKRAVRDQAARHGMTAEVLSSRAFPTIYRVKYDVPEKKRVSIIICTRDHLDDLRKCVDSILEKTTWPDYEIVVVDNGSKEQALFDWYEQMKKQLPGRFVVGLMDEPFNYPRLNNYGATLASGEYLLLLNNDTEVITPEWIEEMMMYVQREDVAAAGAMLYYGDRTIQHAGIILGLGADHTAGHVFSKEPSECVGYMGRACYAQDMTAVTAACMLTKASVWQKLHGMDEQLAVAFNDVDYCMRARKAGYLVVWTPFAELYHYESKSRGADTTGDKAQRLKAEAALFRKRWEAELAAGDPYYNPNFSLEYTDFSLR